MAGSFIAAECFKEKIVIYLIRRNTYLAWKLVASGHFLKSVLQNPIFALVPDIFLFFLICRLRMSDVGDPIGYCNLENCYPKNFSE